MHARFVVNGDYYKLQFACLSLKSWKTSPKENKIGEKVKREYI